MNYCPGYILTYSRAGASESVQLRLQPYSHEYIIDTAEPVEYTVNVAATTRRGAGPARSHAGDDSAAIYSSCLQWSRAWLTVNTLSQ